MIGYDIYDAVEDFEKGDFDSVRDGLHHIGEAIETISDGLKTCKDTVTYDWEKLKEMA